MNLVLDEATRVSVSSVPWMPVQRGSPQEPFLARVAMGSAVQ